MSRTLAIAGGVVNREGKTEPLTREQGDLHGEKRLSIIGFGKFGDEKQKILDLTLLIARKDGEVPADELGDGERDRVGFCEANLEVVVGTWAEANGTHEGIEFCEGER
ncbi:hypothetical protein HPP92_008426 [Vanilla planifolia]|uniref:Uncharacterized protein n=1 Tax=Vanilla planifolia TaxID=51239 RepID=A0A835REB3_VANPL|nr:hypothetical protein HPP92_008426 [Vanilla planifolia]